MALSLSIGLLIDDAIVVRENIVRHADMGKDHRTAAFEATSEIGLAVMATTFAILAVFIPVAFMGGVIGRFFLQFGLTVAVAVLVSLFVSFTLDPMLSAVWKDPPDGAKHVAVIGPVLSRFDRFVEHLHDIYDALLRWALAHRKTTLAIAAASFLASIPVALVEGRGSRVVDVDGEGLDGLAHAVAHEAGVNSRKSSWMPRRMKVGSYEYFRASGGP